MSTTDPSLEDIFREEARRKADRERIEFVRREAPQFMRVQPKFGLSLSPDEAIDAAERLWRALQERGL